MTKLSQHRTHRRSQRSLDAPIQIEPRIKNRLIDMDFFGPLRNAQRLAVKRQQSIRPTIASLLGTAVPYNIAWFIALIVIDTLDCVLRRWARPNVIVKGLEVIDPSFEHGDSASAISEICRVCWVKAPALYVAPRPMLRAGTHAVLNKTQFSIALTTRCRFSPMRGAKLSSATAVAETSPKSLALATPCGFLDYQFSKPSTDRYDSRGWHDVLLSEK